MLLAGLVAGALYNPWSGPQTREWLMDKVAGDDDLQPLDGFDLPRRRVRERRSRPRRTAAAEARRGRAVEATDSDELGRRASGLDPRSGSSEPGR